MSYLTSPTFLADMHHTIAVADEFRLAVVRPTAAGGVAPSVCALAEAMAPSAAEKEAHATAARAAAYAAAGQRLPPGSSSGLGDLGGTVQRVTAAAAAWLVRELACEGNKVSETVMKRLVGADQAAALGPRLAQVKKQVAELKTLPGLLDNLATG